MKRTITKLASASFAVLLLTWIVACTSPNSSRGIANWFKDDYLIMVPPWAKVGHVDAEKMITLWTLATKLESLGFAPLFGKTGIKMTTAFNVNKSGARGSGFHARLTKKQAELLRTSFRFDGKRPVGAPRSELIVSKVRSYTVKHDVESSRMGGLFGRGDEDDGGASPQDLENLFRRRPLGTGPTTQPQWAVDSVFEVQNGTKLTVSQVRMPVVYVVDTGVKPFAGSGSSWSMSDPFVNVKLRQGQIGDGLGSSWPDTNAASPWNTPKDEPLNLSGTFSLYPTTTGFLNPYEDAGGHGTKVASAAVGALIGVVGKLQRTSTFAPVDVELESIRIYATKPGSGQVYNPNPTTSAVVASGIYKAVDAHLKRRLEDGPTAQSVLLFASRTSAGFDEAVEIALWWAWHKGLVCVVSGGNEPGDSSTESMHVPNAMWYSGIGGFPSPQSTSPARFDWTRPQLHPGEAAWWPNPQAGSPSETVPMPTAPYLIIAGGNNRVFSNGGFAGSDHFRRNSSGNFESSRGPDIDILAPSEALSLATAGSNSLTNGNKGTSFAAGYVAGAALAYLACKPVLPTDVPGGFREWLIPPGGPGNGSDNSINPTGWSTGPYRRSPYTHAPLDQVYSGRVPNLYIKNSFP